MGTPRSKKAIWRPELQARLSLRTETAMYFNPMVTSLTRTAVCAWVETAKALRDADGFHLGGVNVRVQSPLLMSDAEIAVIRHVDRFLRTHR